MEQQQAVAVAHVVIIPSPGLGHLIPLTELAKQLVLHHNISVTLLIPTVSPQQPPPHKALIQSLPHLINVIHLPQVDLKDDFETPLVEAKIFLAVTRSIPFIAQALRSLATKEKLAALVVDLFGTDAFDLAAELGVPRYLCHLSPTNGLPLLLSLPELDRTVGCEFMDMVEPVRLPGSVSVHGRDFPGVLQDRKSKNYETALKMAKQVRTCEGIILNDFYDLQPAAIKAMEDGELGSPPVFPVGPLVSRSGGQEDELDRTGCLEWLDRQAPRSVVYVSFGSGGTLCRDQACELALGLEMSEQRFLWVVRIPDETISSGAFFSTHQHEEQLSFGFLPDGFLERTQGGRGLVVANWAPQARILSHQSTGGFITHCGWNSALEGIVHGVPLIAWPLYAEQKLTAVLLAEGIKVGVRVEEGVNGLVAKEEIAQVVKGLMEGENGKEMRGRILKLKVAAWKSLTPDGSSTKSISKLAQKWKEGAIPITVLTHN